MRRAQAPVGPRGLAVLAAAGLVGLALAVHGWSSRGSAPPSSIAVNNQTGASSQPSASRGSPGSASPPRAGPTGAPHSAGPTGAPHSAGPAPTQGPLLASQPYAPYAFLVWPGPPSRAAQAAAAGLSISVRRDTTGLVVSVLVNGQSAGPPHSYRGGARVYVVEAALGDDSGNSDYNLGDDGLVVTNAAGRIVQ